jgi:hypothetical protein
MATESLATGNITPFSELLSEPGLRVLTLLFGGEAFGLFHFVHLWCVSGSDFRLLRVARMM